MGRLETGIELPARSDPVARDVIARWRRLTHGGAPTVIACSGGADSSALALCLAAAGAPLTLCYVLHTMRARPVVEAEARGVAELAERIGAGFARRDLEAPADGPETEGSARRGRYEALTEVAASIGVGYVATGHHAGDQLETVLMALVRGAGPRGLGGAPARRTLRAGPAPVRVIRPMLHVGRPDAEAVCAHAGWSYFEDETNADGSGLRNAIRRTVAPALRRVRADADERAADAARLARDAARVVRDRAEAVFGYDRDAGWGRSWERASLRGERAIVVGEGLRLAALEAGGGGGADRLTLRAVTPAVRAIRSGSTEPKRFHWGRGLTVVVTAREVRLEQGGG